MLLKWIKIFFFIFAVTIIVWSLKKFEYQLPNKTNFLHIINVGCKGWLIYSACFFLANVLRSLRWKVILNNHVAISCVEAWVNFQWLFMIKSFSPFMSGEIVRALWLKTRGGSGSYGLGVFIFERFADIIILFSCSLIVISKFFHLGWTPTCNFALFLIVLTSILLLFFAEHFEFLFNFLILLCKRNIFIQQLFLKRIENLRDAIIGELSPCQRIVVLFMTLGIWTLLAIGISGVLYSLDIFFHWSQPVALLAATNFAGLVSPLPANLGTYQFAGSGLLVQYGVDITLSIIATIVLHIVMLIQVGVVGLTCFAFSNLSKKAFQYE